MNVCQFIGKLTQVPEIKTYGESNNKMVIFEITVERKKKEQDCETVYDYITCVAYENVAVFIATKCKEQDNVKVYGELHSAKKTEEETAEFNRCYLKVRRVNIVQEDKENPKQLYDEGGVSYDIYVNGIYDPNNDTDTDNNFMN